MSPLPRRSRDGWARLPLLNRWRRRRLNSELLACHEFSRAVDKEKARAQRRDLTFCVVRFDFSDDPKSFPGPKFDRLLSAFRKRLRITDEMGLFQSTLGVLLPETMPGDAALVANELVEIAKALNHSVSSDIFAWPVPDDGRPSNRSGNENEPGSFELEINPDGSAFASPGVDGGPVAIATQMQQRTSVSPNRAIKVQALDLSEATPEWKRTMDILGSATGLVVLSPLLLITAIAIKLTSPGPILFRQWREGKDGKLFRIYKFRTMHNGADERKHLFRELSEQNGPAFKIKNDPRLTRLGIYLRRTCIDELPQLFNVLKGEMSLVGPRPLPADESLDCNAWQRGRLVVLPGMTCTWQVSGGRNMLFEDWMRLDLRYIKTRSIWTDAKLLVKTFLVTILHRGSV